MLLLAILFVQYCKIELYTYEKSRNTDIPQGFELRGRLAMLRQASRKSIKNVTRATNVFSIKRIIR